MFVILTVIFICSLQIRLSKHDNLFCVEEYIIHNDNRKF